jgi:hypothetical protein
MSRLVLKSIPNPIPTTTSKTGASTSGSTPWDMQTISAREIMDSPSPTLCGLAPMSQESISTANSEFSHFPRLFETDVHDQGLTSLKKFFKIESRMGSNSNCFLGHDGRP